MMCVKSSLRASIVSTRVAVGGSSFVLVQTAMRSGFTPQLSTRVFQIVTGRASSWPCTLLFSTTKIALGTIDDPQRRELSF